MGAKFGLRRSTAIGLGKAGGALSRRSRRGGGTTLPGLLARWIDPHLIPTLSAQLSRGSILITGTNGKTTTARMVSTILHRAGLIPIHNRAGSNLMRGIATALLEQAHLTGRLRAVPPEADALGLFEVDEGVLPQAVGETGPQMVAILNLFRDQLDRYGEVDALLPRWEEALTSASPQPVTILNADDPGVASLGQALSVETLYFGIEDQRAGIEGLGHAADSTYCPNCGSAYVYTFSFYAHLGHYQCPQCPWRRPTPQIIAHDLQPHGFQGTSFQMSTPAGAGLVDIPLPGLYNVYNALAAAGIATALGIPFPPIQEALQGFTAAFGRAEQMDIQGRSLWMILIKNPAGFNEVLRTLAASPSPQSLWIILNDNLADGRDISWIWDADVELMAGRVSTIMISGRRAEDMTLRWKYAQALPTERIWLEKDMATAFRVFLRSAPGALYVLPTYTAMLELQGLLAKLGYGRPYWEKV